MKPPTEGDVNEVPCYCGGKIRSKFTRDKRTPYGWVFNNYKNPRWQIDNCYPLKAIDYAPDAPSKPDERGKVAE